MKKLKSSLAILMIIMLVNGLSYGTIIPLLYPFASRFGIGPLGLSFLFASFSLAQFIATPILGRLSDKVGRKPVLLFCLLGTSLSLGLFALANTVTLLVIARILDGITGGNISVAQAAVSDSTDGEDRTKAFGFLGASLGFGFVFGPALGGILSEVSITAPFWFASVIGLIGTIAGMIMLEETLPKDRRQSSKQPLFPLKGIIQAFTLPLTGIILFIGFVTSIGQNAWIIGFQSYTIDILRLSTRDVGFLFTGAGLINIVMQSVGIKFLVDKIHSKQRILISALIGSAVLLALMSLPTNVIVFSVLVFLYMAVLSPQGAMMSGLLSERTKSEDQGGIMGINQAYISLGQVIGPLSAGYLSRYSIYLVFGFAAALFVIASISARYLYLPMKRKLDL